MGKPFATYADLFGKLGILDGTGRPLRAGTSVPLALPPKAYTRPRVSPDGSRLAIGVEEGGGADVWVYELSGTSAIRRLTFGGRSRFPVWSPDGRRVAFQSDRDGRLAIYVPPADGAARRSG